MKCPRCQHDNPQGARFCEECATPLARVCSNCGTALSATAKFCHACAHPVTAGEAAPPRSPDSYTPKHLAEKILTSKAALEGERKQVTVLFADLKGSMELLADRDPEEARKILDPVLELMMEAVHRYEGTVNQVMGDGIMALFGAPVAHEDHAVRACYAALDMQAALRRHGDEVRRSHGVEVQVRVGLNSGQVVVRAIGNDLRVDYSAIGQTTHLAARMEQLALPGTIRLTADTLRLAEGYIEVKPLGPVPVKGLVASPVELYELVGAGPLRSRLRAAATRGLTRFVGRDRELEQLWLALGRVTAGHGHVVALVGEPGVGKSRLVWEVTHSRRTHGWSIVQAGSVSYGRATPYLPVIALLKGYFNVQDRDDHRGIREKIIGKLLALDELLKPTLPAFLGLLDVPVEDPQWEALDPPQRRQRIQEAVKRLLFRESQVQPVLALFEDLHWIDTETQALLDVLVDSLPSTRILVLVNYRPEYEHRWASKTYYTQLPLDPLGPDSAHELIHALLGGDPGLRPLARLLIDQTEGNPFFLEESVRTLVETGVLVGERAGYRLARAIQATLVPPTVQAVLAARIDRLSPEAKRLLQTASIIGTEVPFPLLRAVAELPEDALRRHLAHLQAAEFLYETSLFPDLEYTFKHSLTHEVTYGSILQDRRRQLHAALVVIMERHYAGRLVEHAERLAYHAVRGEVWEKAVTHLWQAGRSARLRSAFRPAVAFLEQAVDALKRLPETAERAAVGIDLRCIDLSDPLSTLGRHDRILEHMREAARLAEKVGDRPRLTEVLARTVAPLRRLGRYAQAVAIGERALALSQELADARLNRIAGMELGWVHARGGNLRRAEALFGQVLAGLDSPATGADGPDVVWIRRWTLEGLVEVLISAGRYGEAARLGEQTLRMAEDLGHPVPIVATMYRLASAYIGLGDLERAIALCVRSLGLSRERELSNTIQPAATVLGVAYTLAGRPADAIASLQEAVTVGESTNALDAFTVVSLGHAYLESGRQEDASRCARTAFAMSDQARASVEAMALHLLGAIAARRDPPAIDEATQHYGRALALAGDLGMRPLMAHCHLGLGKVYRRAGKHEEAKERLTTATTMYRDMGMTYWLEKAESEERLP